ncbi:MAG TPA: hypothetical protein VND64_17980 [Pirellulales bacterium]|nr:hypothetical protein [Pirellulales bacterium]
MLLEPPDVELLHQQAREDVTMKRLGQGQSMSDRAFHELVRVLEEAVQAGVTSLGLERKDRELMVFHQTGDFGLGVTRIPEDLQQAVLEELAKRARLARRSKGKMPVTLLGKEFEVVVEEFDSFGESAFNLSLRERKGTTVQ